MKNNTTSLYIHIPFCEHKCFYCSFPVSISQTHRIDLYLDCLSKEAQKYQKEKIHSIYIGGGTPTLMNNFQIEKLFDILKRNFKYTSDIECSMEANPESIDKSKSKLIKALGVNRLSLGIQSLNNKFLKYAGRMHDHTLALKAFDIIRETGFKNINVDLMYAFPSQTLEELQKDVKKILKLNTDHLSLYTLSLDPDSRFYAKKILLPSDQFQSQQYKFITKLLSSKGFKQYEISSFAKKGKESLHNLNYWLGGNYIGLGMGAHSHKDGHRFWNVKKLLEYIHRIENNTSPILNQETLTPSQRYMETLLLGLRMNRGVNINKLNQRFNFALEKDKKNIINNFIKEKFLFWEGKRLKTRLKGRLVLEELSAHLI